MSEVVAWHLHRDPEHKGLFGFNWPAVDRIVAEAKQAKMAAGCGMQVTPLTADQLISLARKFILENMRLDSEVFCLKQDAAGPIAGKPCPVCQSPMSNLTSQYVRLCTNGKCGHTVAWNLNPGQKPLYGSNRA